MSDTEIKALTILLAVFFVGLLVTVAVMTA